MSELCSLNSMYPSFDSIPEYAYSENLHGNAQSMNRADMIECAIEARDDFEAIQRWLNQHRGNAHTFRNYKKEVERLLLWCLLQHKKALSDMNMVDFDIYFSFIENPEPKSFWVADRSYVRSNPNWRPFVGELSDNSFKNALRVINSMMSFLADAGYLKRNPVSLLKRQRKFERTSSLHKRLERILEPDEWQALLDTIELMGESTDKDYQRKSRIRFIFTFMFLTGVRTEEFTQLKWSQIKKRDGHWWLNIKGKRDKETSLPISDELLIHIQKYRTAKGLVPHPLLDEDSPILTGLNSNEAISSKNLYRLIKEVALDTVRRLELVGKKAEKFKQFSGHWIRHYLKSHMSKIGIPYDYQRYIMRHAAQNVTDVYQHGFKVILYKEINKLTAL